MPATIFQQAFLKPGTYKVNGKRRPYTAEKLARYAEGTNKAIKAGVPIPVFDRHAPAGDDTGYPDLVGDTSAPNGLSVVGWVKEIVRGSDGAIGHKIEATNPVFAEAVKNGSVKFVSPEFRENYESADGSFAGPMIRHLAVTGLPRSGNQTPLEIEAGQFSENAVQFSLDDLEDEIDPEGDDDEMPDEEPEETDVTPPANPDLVNNDGAAQKCAACVAFLSKLGVELPADYDFSGGPTLDVLLAALKTAAAAKDRAEVEAPKEEPNTTEAPAGVMFSEDEISAVPPALRAKLEAQNKAAAQFAEERIKARIAKASETLRSVWLPPRMRAALEAPLTAAQFSEMPRGRQVAALEQAAATAALFAENLPPALRFDEQDTKPATEPHKDFFSPPRKPGEKVDAEEAKAINDEWDAAVGRTPPKKQTANA